MTGKAWSLGIAAILACVFMNRTDASEPAFYVAASLGQADEDPESAGTNVGNSQGVFHVDPDSVEIDDGSLAWSVGLGYRINQYLAGELEYIDFGTTGIAEHYSVPNPGPITFPTVFTLDQSSRVTGPALSVLGSVPVGANFEVFVRGGVLFASREITAGSFRSLDEKFASTVWLAGAGVTWSFQEHWGVRAEYQQTGAFDETIVSGETKLQRISLSALFSF